MKIVVFLTKPRQGNYDLSRSILNSFVKAMRNKTIDILIIDTLNQNTIKDTLDFSPDFVLTYELCPIFCGDDDHFFKNHEEKVFLRKAKIPVISLYYDAPFSSIDNDMRNELLNYGEYYFHFIFDDCLLVLFKDAGYKNGYKILLSVDPEEFAPEANVVVQKSLGFVGLITSRDIRPKGDFLIDSFIDQVIKLKIECMEVPTFLICMSLFSDSRYKPIYEIYLNESVIFWRVVYYFINIFGTAVIREHVLKGIKNIDINLFGDRVVLGSNIKSFETVPYGKPLSRLYQEHIINLNISALQLEASVNNRVFDVFASKGFLLSDYKLDMEKIFQGYWKKITYKNVDELNDKIEYYLSHEKERQEIIEIAYHDIVNNHTYEHRVDQIIQTFLDHRGKVGTDL